ncbi:MAG: SRPBCC family protein [Prevotella sp.]|jgi:carbon monoxide dehydrogenase subunit G|nr:SRPBCC family protein [Prevotella sp.]MBQ6162278.1 SRPBCC family protein [Prevotella sp.]MBQ6186484.1 SRPBCC family protein [Prevotella sp.]
MTKFESSVRQIDAPQQKIYDTLSNLENLEKIRDRIPEDKADDFSFDNDSISVRVNPVGMVKFKIIEREEPKTIKFEAEGSPVPVNFWIQILPVEETTAKMKLTIKADIPFFMKGMVQKPLEQGIEKIADILQMIKYE